LSKVQGLAEGRGLRRDVGQRVTLRTVATALGLSVTTVSRALKKGLSLHRTIIGEDPAELREVVRAEFVDHRSQLRRA